MGIAWLDGALVLLSAPDGTIHFHVESAEPCPNAAGTPLLERRPLGQGFSIRSGWGEEGRTLALHPKGALFEMTTRNDRELWLPVAWDVAAFAPVGGRAAFITREAAAERWRVSSLGTDEPRSGSFAVNGRGRAAFFGFGGKHAHRRYGYLALEQAEGCWMVLDGGGWSKLRAPAAARVVGVSRAWVRHQEPGLLVVEADGRRLSLVGQGWSRTLALHAPAPLEDVTASPVSPVVACTTSDGDVLGYSLEEDSPLFCLTPEDQE